MYRDRLVYLLEVALSHARREQVTDQQLRQDYEDANGDEPLNKISANGAFIDFGAMGSVTVEWEQDEPMPSLVDDDEIAKEARRLLEEI